MKPGALLNHFTKAKAVRKDGLCFVYGVRKRWIGELGGWIRTLGVFCISKSTGIASSSTYPKGFYCSHRKDGIDFLHLHLLFFCRFHLRNVYKAL